MYIKNAPIKTKTIKIFQPHGLDLFTFKNNVDSDNGDDEISDLNNTTQFDLTDENQKKYDDMVFIRLKFDLSSSDKCYSDLVNANNDIHKCTYLTPDQFNLSSSPGVNNLF